VELKTLLTFCWEFDVGAQESCPILKLDFDEEALFLR